MPVAAITSLSEFNEKIRQDKPVLIDFWVECCGPCRQIFPLFEKLSNLTENVEFYKVNIDDLWDVSQQAGIRAMPTFILYKKGEKVLDLVGADHPHKLELLVMSAKAL